MMSHILSDIRSDMWSDMMSDIKSNMWSQMCREAERLSKRVIGMWIIISVFYIFFAGSRLVKVCHKILNDLSS
jgi:hypothetical protein